MINPYEKLDKNVQKWIYSQGWAELRDIQKQAIIPILDGDCDVLISASTAAGKTEAFFLPACTVIKDVKEGFGILCISPLKALINDQYRRLLSLCEETQIELTPWHGDVSQSKKKQARKHPSGILLITPESLESLLINNPEWVHRAFMNLRYILVDEFHAFIGRERGHQLLSQMNRIEHLLGRYDSPIPRIALSATLGDLEEVPNSLRPNKSLPCVIITSNKSVTTINLQVKGYADKIDHDNKDPSEGKTVCLDIYRFCRGRSNLVFANSRKRTEYLAASLKDLCEENVVPNEFFPHHGSLAKSIREDLESRLQESRLPTTAVCTMTLELGIDIGKVESVIQVTAPHAVSSLRQRVGRSGRRDQPAILRMLISENELTNKSSLNDCLRIELLQSLAMIRLLISNKWFEPADTEQLHLSTLFHQILSVIAQWGGVRADQLLTLLCKEGPFHKISISQFKALLQHMGMTNFITQLPSGELIIDIEGEKLVNHYSFYSVFLTPEEYRIVTQTKTLGTIPVDSLLLPGQHIIFGGCRWRVQEIDIEKKVIRVESTKGGLPPKFGGAGISIHDVVRQEMYQIYAQGDYRIQVGTNHIDFIDDTAKQLFYEGLEIFNQHNLKEKPIIHFNDKTYVIPWLGDKVVNTIFSILIENEFQADFFAGIIEISNATVSEVEKFFGNLLKMGIPSGVSLAEKVPEKVLEKFDKFLPDALLNEGYAQHCFDIEGTTMFIKKIVTNNM